MRSMLMIAALGLSLSLSVGCGCAKKAESSGADSPKKDRARGDGTPLASEWSDGPSSAAETKKFMPPSWGRDKDLAKETFAKDKAPSHKSSDKDAPPKTDPAVVTKGEIESKAPPVVAVAEAVTGVERTAKKAMPEQTLPSGILTAGSFDDNLEPAVFRSFVTGRGQRQDLGDLPGKLNGQRLLVLVKDGAGKPLGGARVKLAAGPEGGVEIVTRADGRAVFMLSFDQLPAGAALTATVTPADGSGVVTESIGAGLPRWEITLAKARAQLPKLLDLAFVVDTTGSMGDELTHLKAEVKGISAAIQKKFPEVQQRFALVLYRDEGDEYVTRAFDFTSSLDDFHKKLAAQTAAGGGDYPEAMHKGLEEANQLRWRDADVARVLFLIADAPPHGQHINCAMSAVNRLRQRGVGIYPVACSGYDDACEFVMRSSALLTGGRFLFLTDDSGVGNSHAEPKIPYYQVERLERLMARMIAGELTGRTVEPAPADILRTVGRKIN